MQNPKNKKKKSKKLILREESDANGESENETASWTGLEGRRKEEKRAKKSKKKKTKMRTSLITTESDLRNSALGDMEVSNLLTDSMILSRNKAIEMDKLKSIATEI